MIHITEKQTGKILDFIPLGDFWDDNHHRSLKDTLEIFDFKTFGDKRYSEHLAKMNRVIIPDEDGTNTEFVIDNTFKYRNNSTLVTEVYASASYLLLRKAKVIKPQKVVGYTGSQHLGFALSGTEWRPGIVESDNIRTIEIENYTNPYAYIKKIASELNLEIRFRIEDDGQKVIGRYVDLLERVGQWRGREVEFGRDLLGIERKVDDSNIVTALIGLGPEQEDGSRTEVFVEDRDALQRWGIPNPQTGELMHLIETYEPQFTEENPSVERLRELTQNELEKRINSLVEYEGDIADLEKVPGMENKIIRFGDTIKIKDTGFNPPLYLEARIHTQDRSLSDPSQKRITLGDFIEYTEEEVFAAWKSLQARINERLAKMVIVNIVADGGIAFKNGLGSTDLKAVTYLQGQEVDKEGVIYNYLWRVYDKNGNLVDSSVGKQFTVYAKDIDEKATYIVTVSENGNDMSSAVVTVTNVFDGEDGEQGPQGPKGDKGDPGPQGPPGTSVESIIEYYLATDQSSGVTRSTPGWTTTIQQMTPQKRYLWNYERINFSDGTHQNTNPVIIGVYGDEGEEGRSIVGITEYYLATNASSGVTRSTPGWTTTMQVTTPEKKYLWNYEKITWNKAPLETYTEPVIIGAHGEQGPKGEDGKTFYTWIKYADTPTSGMSDNPEGKEYIGIAYNKETPTPSTNYSDYVWSKFKGEQGIPGPPGEDGQPTYTWVKYADDDKGNGMSDSPEGKLYIGLAFNKTTPEESNNPADYTWSLMPQNIEIGGRNLVLNSNLPKSSAEYLIGVYDMSEDWEIDTEYTITIKGTVNENQSFGIWANGSDTKVTYFSPNSSGVTKHTFKTPTSINTQYPKTLRVYNYPSSGVVEGNIEWIKLEKGNKATDWTPAPEDVQAEIEKAKQDAQNAQQTADGKNTVFYQSTKPSLMGRKEGDLWFKSDEGYKPFRFNGSDFVEASFGHQAIATLDLGKATVGKLSGQFIETKTLEAGHIKSLNGLNIGNGQFVVDSNGNAKFGGHLESASGTFGEVSVKDGDFYLEDTNSDTRYSIVGRTNLIKDHSFELVEVVDPTGQDNIDHNWLDMKDVNEFSNTSWVKVGTPKVAVTGIAGPAHQNARPIFGEKAIVVNSNNYVTQKLWEIAENTKYALSVYTKRSWNNTPGAVRLEVYHISYDSLGNSTRRLLISKNFNPVLSNYEVTRCSISFTTPPLEGSYDEIEIVIRGTNSNWIQCDGVQLVVGDYPSVYNSEDTVWYVIRGDIIIGTSQNILWEGGAFMRGDQTIYPSKRLSECQNGWCFVWSDYSTQSNNWDIVYSFVPKTRYGNHTLFIVPTTEANSNQYTIKALSLFDDRISGLNTNQNGINANNAVLRAVLEY